MKMTTIFINGLRFEVLGSLPIPGRKLAELVSIPPDNATIWKVMYKGLSNQSDETEINPNDYIGVSDNQHFKIIRKFVHGG